jgi:hypothetical protein
MDDKTEFTVRVPNVGRMLNELFPEDFRTHMRAAQREQLLAVRALIDAALERMDRPADANPPRKGRVEIAVE